MSEHSACFVSSCDENYIEHFIVMLKSAEGQIGDTDYFLFHDSVTQDIEKRLYTEASALNIKLHLIDFNKTVTDNLPSSPRFTKATWIRCFIPEILPKLYTRIIYLDVDMIICGNLTPLVNFNLDGQPFAAVPDIGSEVESEKESLGLSSSYRYFNSGVMVIDRQAWISENIGSRAISYGKQNPKLMRYYDQSALNALCLEYKYLDQSWNYWPIMSNHKVIPKIIHYVGRKPWDKKFRPGSLFYHYIKHGNNIRFFIIKSIYRIHEFNKWTRNTRRLFLYSAFRFLKNHEESRKYRKKYIKSKKYFYKSRRMESMLGNLLHVNKDG